MKMKSKPTNKKLKVEVTNLGPPTTPEKGGTATPSLSPASSTVSNASSLLSIGPPSYTVLRPAVEAATGSAGGSATSAKSATSKAKGAKGDKDGAKGAAVVADATGANPGFPLLTHFNLAEFPKINACLLGSKGGAGSQGGMTPGPGDANKPIDTLTMEDIDSLQAELETLWSNVASRIRLLNREQNNLQSLSSTTTTTTTTTHHHNIGMLEHFDPQHQEKIASVAAIIDHGTRTSVSAAAKLVMGVTSSPVPSPSPAAQSIASTPGGKRSATSKGERLPKKKLKGEGGGVGKAKKAGAGAAAAVAASLAAVAAGVEKPAARATQNRSHSVSSDFGTPMDGSLKHEVPTQFWENVEAYCRDLMKDDVEGLNMVLEQHGELDQILFDIPALGKHFKDNDDTPKPKVKEPRANGSNSKDCVGPLTQRLVSALVDERVSMFNNNHLNSPKEDASLGASGNPEGGYFLHRHGLVRALGLDSGGGGASSPSLENRIRDCLVDHGLLPPDDANDPILLNPDDELLAEIKRTQSVLKKVHTYNADKLLGVIDSGKRAVDRNVHKKDLEKADRDVFEAFKNVATYRLKKKPLTKKEKDSATKTLEGRKRVLVKLESIRGPRDNGIMNIYRNGGAGSALSNAVAPVDPNNLLMRAQFS